MLYPGIWAGVLLLVVEEKLSQVLLLKGQVAFSEGGATGRVL